MAIRFDFVFFVALIAAPALAQENGPPAAGQTGNQNAAGAQAAGGINAAQTGTPNGEPTLSDVMMQLQRLEQNLASISQNMTDANQQLLRHAQAIDALREQGNQLAELRQRLDTVEETLRQDIARQQQILEAISTQDSSGQPIPRISSIMQASPQFRQEMQQAVQQSLQSEGEFVVNNKTGATQTIYVNRKPYVVQPGMAMTVRVPVGTVTTQLAGQEMKNWAIAPPLYRESVDLVPKTTTSTLSPIVFIP